MALRSMLPPPSFLNYQDTRNIFLYLETRIDHMNFRREEDVTLKRREHTLLTKTLLRNKPPPTYAAKKQMVK